MPKFQRGSVSALLGIAQNVGILGGTYVAQVFQHQMLILFVAPSILAIGAMLLFAFILPDQRLTGPPAADEPAGVGHHLLGRSRASTPTSRTPGGRAS